jgi:subtilisin family serine protease
LTGRGEARAGGLNGRAAAWLVVLALLAASAPAAAADAATGPSPAAEETERVLVWFRPGADEQEILASHGVQAAQTDRTLGLAFVPVDVRPGTAERVAAALRRESGVDDAILDVPVQAIREPSDEAYPAQWAPRQIRASRAWEITVGRPDTIVAVLDTGVEPHADLPARALVRGYNAFDGSDRTLDDDPGRHGTSVATVAAARGDNGIGTAGYCWTCRVMPVKVLDQRGRGGVYEVVAGIRYAANHGARIINLSLVIGPNLDGRPVSSRIVDELRAAVDEAEVQGAVVVAAAGNHGSSELTYPSALPIVVGVSANNREGERMTYAAYGDWIEVTAPGCHAVVPVSTLSFCGTSSAAPAVAGTLALASSVVPSASPAALRSALFATTSAGPFVRHGRVDAGRVVDRLLPASATAPAVALTGDWNGDGKQTPGWFRNGAFYLRFRNEGGPPDLVVPYGRKGDLPLVGDWNGDGRDTLGIVRDGEWHLRHSLTPGPGQIRFTYGRVSRGDRPLVGDWNGNGRDTIGIVRGDEWHLRDVHEGGSADRLFVYGRVAAGDVPLIGDWNGDGRDTVGIVRGDRWMLRDSLTAGNADREFVYGTLRVGDQPVVGDWTGTGPSMPAVARGFRSWELAHSFGASQPDRTFRTLAWSWAEAR